MVHEIIVILHGQTSNQLVIGERNCEMSFQFHSKANFQNFVQAIKSTNLQTHEPVYLRKPRKLNPTKIKYFTVFNIYRYSDTNSSRCSSYASFISAKVERGQGGEGYFSKRSQRF